MYKRVQLAPSLTMASPSASLPSGHRQNKLFRRIEADLKERDRRRLASSAPRSSSGHVLEQYVDRDRVIAVTPAGVADIRDTMLKQRLFVARDSHMAFEDEQIFNVLVEQAKHNSQLAKPQAALSFLDQAVRMVPDDAESRILRALNLVKSQRFSEAIEDIDLVLEIEQNKEINKSGSNTRSSETLRSRAFAIKGDALYHLGHFEHALVYYHRALHHNHNQKDAEHVRLGIGRAEEAVVNVVGRQDVVSLPEQVVKSSIPSSIFEKSCYQLQTEMDALQRIQVVRVTSDDARSRLRRIRVKRRETSEKAKKREQRIKRQLLGKMAVDLDYLEKLTREKRLLTPADRQEAEAAVEFLRDRKNFWSQFKPFVKKN